MSGRKGRNERMALMYEVARKVVPASGMTTVESFYSSFSAQTSAAMKFYIDITPQKDKC